MEEPNPFLPDMIHFALPLHALREELLELATRWSQEHGMYVSAERFFPTYAAVSLPLGADIAEAIVEHEPVRRLSLRRDGPFFEGAINERQHLVWNPECLTMVLEPVSEDGLRATALTSKMGDEQGLREWAGLVREAAMQMHRGSWAVDPEQGNRQQVGDHFHTVGAHDLAVDGVPMLAANGSAVFEFFDLM
ncbi:MAG TPA: hypothetical protein VGF63_09240 [Solirubrobacteraceae bacterium]|jgi:hypothetical protein